MVYSEINQLTNLPKNKDCPHYKKYVDIDRFKTFLLRPKNWKCKDCSKIEETRSKDEGLWCCLTCIYIGCSRYANGHSLHHFQKLKHPITINLLSGAIYCYQCDDYIMNDIHSEIKLFIQVKTQTYTKSATRRGTVYFKSEENNSITLKGGDRSAAIIDNSNKENSDINNNNNNNHQINTISRRITRSCSKKRKISHVSLDHFVEPNRKRRKLKNNKIETVVVALNMNDNNNINELDDISGIKNNKKKKYSKKKKTSTLSSRALRRRTNNEDDQILDGLIGLKNLGNTCYMNSVLQILTHTDSLRKYFLSLKDKEIKKFALEINYQFLIDLHGPVTRNRLKETQTDEISLSAELKKTFDELWNNTNPAIQYHNPESLLATIWRALPIFHGYHQQDSHEFLRYFLERLRSEVNIGEQNARKNSENIITNIFQGRLLNEITCLNCNTVSTKQDPFMDISLDIPEDVLNNYENNDPEETLCSVYDCLENFVKPESLNSTERYICGHCQSNNDAIKKFTINNLPSILCLHLKRFRWEPREKISSHIEFPFTLDLSQFTTKNNKFTNYQLFGVISHHGKGTSYGHYTAHCLNNDNWIHYDDASVRKSTKEQVSNSQAYILFFKRIKE